LSVEQGEDGFTTLRMDVTDIHYAQLFFVVGHTAIKMLSFIEQIDNDLKKAGSSSANHQQNDAPSNTYGRGRRTGAAAQVDEGENSK